MLSPLEVGTFFANVQNNLYRLASNSRVAEKLQHGERRGGYVCIARQNDGIPIFIAEIGLPNKEKRKIYFEFCQEKASRLAAHRDEGHVLSRQSRDTEKKHYAGAVLFHYAGVDLIASFSGLPDDLDEILMFIALQESGFMMRNESKAILGQYENPYQDLLFPE